MRKLCKECIAIESIEEVYALATIGIVGCDGCGKKIKDAEIKSVPDFSPKSHLACRVNNGSIVVSIGIDTLSFAFEHSPYNQYLKNGDYVKKYKVIDKMMFAKDVVRELNTENEVAVSLVTDAIDRAIQKAIEGGSLAVEDLQFYKARNCENCFHKKACDSYGNDDGICNLWGEQLDDK